MSKTPMTWLGLIKLKLSEEKGKSLNDVMPAAKKEWVQIKEGKHPKYIQGKAQTFGRKKKGNNKSRTADKNSSSASSSSKKGSRSSSSSSSSQNDNSSHDHTEEIHALLSKVKLCGKCKKNVEKILKKKEMTGGFSQFYDVPPLVSGAQGALPLTEVTDSSPIPFEGKSSASSSAPFQGGAGQTGGKRGRKGSKGRKGNKKGGCGGGSCVMGGGSKLPVQSPANVA